MKLVTKLVRDGIPDILASKGRLVSVREVKGEELCKALMMKLREEVEELASNPCIEEVADVLEVLDAVLTACIGGTMDDAMRVKKLKKERLGGFEHGYVATYYEVE